MGFILIWPGTETDGYEKAMQHPAVKPFNRGLNPHFCLFLDQEHKAIEFDMSTEIF
jgi:hypothetical protein